MFDSDPLAERRKGWTPRPQGGVKLVSSWQQPEKPMGAGAEYDAGAGTPDHGPEWFDQTRTRADPYNQFQVTTDPMYLPPADDDTRPFPHIWPHHSTAPMTDLYSKNEELAPSPAYDQPNLLFDDSEPFHPNHMTPYYPPATRLRVGSGADGDAASFGIEPIPNMPAGETITSTPLRPADREEWRTATPSLFANPEPTEYPSSTGPSIPPSAPFKPAVPAKADVPGSSGAPTPRVPAQQPAGGVGGGTPSSYPSTRGIIDVAKSAIGSKYIWGGPGGRSSFDPQFVGSDCSGFTAWAYYNATGIKIPAFTGSIYQVTKPITRDQAQPGDIVMWGMQNSGADEQHVGIYAGNGTWIHDSSVNPNGGVQLTPLWKDVEFRRVPGVDTSQAPNSIMSGAVPEEKNPATVWAAQHPQPANEGNPAAAWQNSHAAAQPPAAQNPDRNPAEAVQQRGGNSDEWFSYADNGREIVKKTYGGNTTFEDVGAAQGDPGSVIKSGTLGSGADYDAGEGANQGDDPWSLFDPNNPAPSIPSASINPGTQSSVGPGYDPVTPMEKHITEMQMGTPSDELTNPKRNEHPTTPAIKPEAQQEPQSTIFDIPVVKSGFSAETQPLPLPKPDVHRPIQPYTPPEGEPVLPTPEDPNKDLTPIGRQIAGAPVNPIELKDEIQGRFDRAVVPQQIQDAPAVGGLVEMALDPAWMSGGVEQAGNDLALQAGGKLVKAIGGNVIAKAPYAVRLADATLGYAAKSGADALMRGLDRLQPGLGAQVAKELPAMASAEYAKVLGGGAVAGAVTAAVTPDDDPNRYAKIIGAAGIGAMGTLGALHVTPAVVKGFNELFAPTKNLPSHVQGMFAQLAHAAEGGRVSGDMIEQRILDVMAERRLGFPKRGTGGDVWQTAAEFERTKGFGSTMTPAQQALADDMWDYGERTRKEGKRLGFIKGDVTLRPGVEAYFPHVWADQWQATQTAATKRGLNPHDFFTDFRTHDTLQDGVTAGLTPVQSMSEAWGAYVRRYESSKAKRQFALALRKDGGPSVIRRIGKNKANTPEGWVSGAQFSIPGLEQFALHPDVGAALHNLENPSWMRQFGVLRGTMDFLGEMKRALFAPSAFHLVHELHQTINAQGKEGIPVFAKAMYYNLNPWAYRKFMVQNADRYIAAANAGVTMMRHNPEAPDIGAFGIANPILATAARSGVSGALTGAGGYLQSKAQLDDDQTAITKGLQAGGLGAALGAAGGPISRGLWERSVPTMKLLTWETMRTRYGEKPAAEFVNEVFGGQNLEAIARSKSVQDVLRLVTLAPDWQEGWVRQIGNGVRGLAAIPYAATHGGTTNAPLATANSWYWANAALSGAFMLEGLNYAFNGQFTNENSDGHQLTLETTGLYDKMGWPHKDDKGRPYRAYMDVLGPYRGLIQAPFDPGKFLQARLGLGPSAIGEIASGKDFTGKDIVPPGEDPLKNAGLRFAHAVSRLAPVSGASLVQTMGKEPGAVSAVSAVTGWRTSQVSPIAEQLRARDKALSQIGLSQDRIQRANETYTNLLGQADRDFETTIGRKNLTHQQIDNELAKIKHPDRADIMTASLPTNMAGDPAKEAELRDVLRKYSSFGTGSTEYPADVQPESGIDVAAAAGRYWNPKPGIDALPKNQADSLRQKELAQMANEYDTDVNTLADAIKAQTRGTPLKPVPGITSAAIDTWVSRWAGQTNDDPMQQAAMRRDAIDTIAREHNLDPDTVWQRIKIRYLPPDKPGEMEQSRDKALDMLFAAHDPQRFPKYSDPTGKPMGGPDQWASFDAQVAGAKTAHDKAKPEVKALIAARDAATATQRKYILNNPDYKEYQRWFGIGRGMNEAQWNKYVKGEYPHYKDTSDPAETINRDKIAELYKASTVAERRTQMVRITIQGKTETLSLSAAQRHLQFELKTGWSKALGLDTTGSGDLSSEGT